MIIAYLSAFLLTATSARAETEMSFYSTVTEKLEVIDSTDGISFSEADVISDYFFHFYENVGCGAPGKISESNTHWVVQTSFGYGGRSGDPFYINKSSGSITWRNKECVANPKNMLDEDLFQQKCGLANE